MSDLWLWIFMGIGMVVCMFLILMLPVFALLGCLSTAPQKDKAL